MSDVSSAAANDVGAVEIPSKLNVIATYPIAIVEGTDDAQLAEAFVALVTGDKGRDVLERFGFEPLG